MGLKKTAIVELIKDGDTENPMMFNGPHAENLIALQQEKGWKNYTLPEGSPFEIVNGKLIERAGKPTVPNAKKQGATS